MHHLENVEQYFVDDLYLISKMPKTTRIEEVLEHYRQLKDKIRPQAQLKVLIDCSESDFLFNPRSIHQIIDGMSECLMIGGSLKEAILVAKPYETGIASLFQKRVPPNDQYQFTIFSTREAALSWLLS